MPNRLLRIFLVIGAVLAAVMMAGIGAGPAAAEPDPADPSGNGSEPGGGTTPPSSSEPQPSATPPPPPPSIFDIPRTIAGQLNDFLRPFTVFGNGRTPGEHTVPGATLPGETATTDPTTPTRKKDRPTVEPKPPPVPEPEPAPPPRPRPTSSVDVTLPFAAPVSIPIPSLTVPGYENMRWTLNLTDPRAAYASLQDTLNTFNSLLADAYAPFNPFPPPKPEPTFRILQEDPVVEADGTSTPLSGSSDGLPILQAPMVIPPLRVEVPGPVTGALPAAQAPRPAVAEPGTGAPVVRVPEAPVQAGQAAPGQAAPGPGVAGGGTPAVANPPVRQGYPQYLRVARPAQLTAVALPGLVGLMAITAGGSVIGYRQANSGRHLRTEAARFLP